MGQKTKVLHLIQSLNSGGCENFLLRVLPLVDQYEHLVVTLGERGELAEKFEMKGIRVIEMNGLVGLWRIIKEEKPNLIITYLARADMIGRFWLSFKTDCPVIPFLRTTYNYSRYWLIRVLEKISHFWVKKYLANSEAVKSFYEDKIGVAKGKITVIPNGLTLGRHKTIEGNEPRKTIFVCVANFHPNKGHEYLVKAFRKVKEGKLVLVGDGEVRKKIEIMARDLDGKVVFLGKRNDVAKILNESDVFVLPTLFEGMSNAILEAMAVGLPVVTTDILENRELIDEKNGILVKIRDVDGLSRAMDRLGKNPELRKKLGLAGRRVIEQKYDIKLVAEKLDRFFDENTKI